MIESVPWWYKYQLFTLHRKNVDVLEAQIKTLDSLAQVSKNNNSDGHETRVLIEKIIENLTETLEKV